jgi:hypothetical protein
MCEEQLTTIKSNKIGGKKVKIIKNTNIYPIQSILSNDETTQGITRISLCIYRINIKPSSTPFLEYLLMKNNSDTMVFPGFLNGGNKRDWLNTAHACYNKIVGQSNASVKHLKGMLKIDNVLYIFYHYVHTSDDWIENPYKPKSDELWWCLMDEICNWQKVLSMKVDRSVVNLFYKKPELIYLYDTNYNKLEVPIVCYYGTHYKLLEFIYTFGVKENDVTSKYGPYYYFTTYNNAFKYAGWYHDGIKEMKNNITVDEKGRLDKGGILRSALFMNNVKVFLNHPLDEVDNSEFATTSLKDVDIREKMKYQLKMLDYYGKWANEYDSVYVGKVMLDNGELMFECPEMVVKNNSQQVVLSIHIVNKKTIGDKWNPLEEGYDFL